MTQISYKTKLIFDTDADCQKLIDLLLVHRDVVNFIFARQFEDSAKLTQKLFHDSHYYASKNHFGCKSQIVIRALCECLGSLRSIKSNKQKLEKAPLKKKLSCRLDHNLYSFRDGVFRFTTNERRVVAKPHLYEKLETLLAAYKFGDPLLSVADGRVWITLTFDIPCDTDIKATNAIGVDFGIRRIAATSDGVLIIDKGHNAKQRATRYLKRKLQSSGTRSAKRKLKKLRRKERNRNRNFRHHVANAILRTHANCIALEDLGVARMKKKQHAYQNKSRISQIGFTELKTLILYKAALLNKVVVCVNPAYTSQTDSVTGKREGVRKGCRFYSKSGLVYDADVNAACNIARLGKLPFSQGNLLDGQATVIRPIVRPARDVQVHSL